MATTTKNIKKASNVLKNKIERTEAEMKKKMARAGVEEYKTVKVMVPKSRDDGDDVLMIGLNGEPFHFLRGKTVNMPEPLLMIMENTGNL